MVRNAYNGAIPYFSNPMNNSFAKTRLELLMLFLLYAIILPRVYMTHDMGAFKEWALYIHQHGLQNAYGSQTNYPPIFLHALYVYDLLQGTEANIMAHINNIKLLFLFFDFLPIIVLCAFRQRILSFNIPYLYLLINVAYLFNSMVWGQMDSMYVNVVFLAMVTGVFYPAVAAMLFVLAVNIKFQAIIFAPVLGIILLYSIKKLKTILVSAALAVAVQVLIFMPFIVSHNVGSVIYMYTHSVGYYPRVSISAFNLWYIILPQNPYEQNDSQPFLFATYRNIGLILFAVSSCAVLVVILKNMWQAKRKNIQLTDWHYQLLFLGSGMITFCFFYFNTQMHERYAHALLIFFFFYGVASKNYKLYALISIPYFLSLDKSFSYPDGYLPITHYKIIYASRIIAIWYTAAFIYSTYLFYTLAKKPATIAG